jgi:uncharacterized protein (TIGR00730 family)
VSKATKSKKQGMKAEKGVALTKRPVPAIPIKNSTPTPVAPPAVGEGASKAAQAVPGTDINAPKATVTAAARQTDDFALLNPAQPDEQHFTQSDTWRILRIQSEFVHSFERMSKVGPAIAVFGSARINEESPYYEMAREVSGKLTSTGWAVITGGGPGLMAAANRGAQEGEMRALMGDNCFCEIPQNRAEMNAPHITKLSVGLNIELPFEQHANPFLDSEVNFHYFFCRKTNFVKYASGFVILPGGFGTMDELFEALTLVQTRKIQNFPIVLMGSEYWKGLLDWIRQTMVTCGTILPADLDLMYVTDDVDDAVQWIFEHTRQVRHPESNHNVVPPYAPSSTILSSDSVSKTTSADPTAAQPPGENTAATQKARTTQTVPNKKRTKKRGG